MATAGTDAVATGTSTVERKPVFVKVKQLQPGTTGHTLTVKVIEANTVVPASSLSDPSQHSRIVECLVGDQTGCILFTARIDQVDLMKLGATVILHNSRIDMFEGTMRLVVDESGCIEATEPASFTVREGNHLSLVEYALINVKDEISS